VAKLIEVALVLVANPSTGPKSITDMIDRSKTTPSGLTYGSTGTNSSQHLSVELLKRETGANLVHVPYRGSAPAVVDVIAGDYTQSQLISLSQWLTRQSVGLLGTP
jgi:tripartite-type tricarboxylate transporter receptor subunit TctC